MKKKQKKGLFCHQFSLVWTVRRHLSSLTLLLCLQLVLGTIAWGQIFNTRFDYNFGDELMGDVATGDFNGDENLDVVVVNGLDQSIYIYLGNGDGTLGEAALCYSGINVLPWAGDITIAYINGDDDLDLVVPAPGQGVHLFLGNGDGTFNSPAIYPFASPSVAIADIDGDTAMDMAVGESENNTVSVLLGNGDGSFQSPISIDLNDNPSYSPTYIDLYDLNNDGNPDLIMRSALNNKIWTMLGNSDGTFQEAVFSTIIDVGSQMWESQIAIGTFDNNNTPDLVLCPSMLSGGGMFILLGNGDGTFQESTRISTGTNHWSIAVGDLDGNGTLDLTAGNYYPAPDDSYYFSVYLGNGDGTFGNAINYLTEIDACPITLGDFDGDGTLDLAGIESSKFSTIDYDDKVFVFIQDRVCGDSDNDGYGNQNTDLCLLPDIDCNESDPDINPGEVEACDNGIDDDCDGAVDYEDSDCPCLDNDDDGYGQPENSNCTNPGYDCDDDNPAVNPAGEEGPIGDPTCSDTLDNDCSGGVDLNDPNCVECIDLDGDGYGFTGFIACPYPEPDCNDANSEIYPGQNEVRNNLIDDDCNSETIDQATPFYRCQYSYPTLMVQEDLNGDGDLELATTTLPNLDFRIPQGTLELFNNQGKGTMPFGGNYSLLSIAFGDLNGDDYHDLIAFTYDFWDAYIMVGNGNGKGTFSDWAMYTLAEDSDYMEMGHMELGDLDNDSDLDLVVDSVEGLYILINNGDGTFQDPATLPYYGCALGDLDDNGNIDIITTGTGQEALILFGNGDGTFQSPISYNVDEGIYTWKPGDVNGDDDPDLILLHYGSSDTPGSISIMLNDGSGNFLSPINFPTGKGSNAMDMGDLNGDSHLDIAVNNYYDYNISIYYGNGDGTFQTPVNYAPGYYPLSLDIGDQDGDGDLDIAVSDAGNPATVDPDDIFSGPKGLIYMLFNNGDGTFSPPPSSPASPWGAASVVGMEQKSVSEAMNHLLMLLVPLGILVFWRGRSL